jgi:hypothetical protein
MLCLAYWNPARKLVHYEIRKRISSSGAVGDPDSSLMK